MITMFFKSFLSGMKMFSENIAIIVNTALLFITYVVGVGLSFLISKISNKKFLDDKVPNDATTYWENIDIKNDEDSYYKQF